MIDEAFMPVSLRERRARQERIREREDAVARVPCERPVDVLHEGALDAAVDGHGLGERVALGKRRGKVVGNGHHDAVPDAVVAVEALLGRVALFVEGAADLVGCLGGRPGPSKHVLEEAVLATAVQG